MMKIFRAIRKNSFFISRIFLAATISLLLLASALPYQAAAQSVTVGGASGMPGSAVDLTINFTPGSTGVATLQFDLGAGPALTAVSTSTGTAATNAGKSANGSAISGGVRVIIFGMNQTAIGAGSVCVVRFNIAGGTAPSTLPIVIGNVVASDAQGVNVSTSSTGGSITVTSAGDVDAPIITGVSSSGVTSSGATISWTTNEASNTQVDYGTTLAYGSYSSAGPMITSHVLQLSNLAASTLFHYRVKSQDAAGNPATSEDFTFTTSATIDITPPNISNVTASLIQHSSVTISWVTDEASDSIVDFGPESGYGRSSTSTAMVTSHSLQLTGLTTDTIYHYRVKSRDAATNQKVSGDFTFRTALAPDIVAPEIRGITASSITHNSATISWITNEAADTQLDYGTNLGYGSYASSSARVTTHVLQLSNLTASTLYHYRVKSMDAAGNTQFADDMTFTTAETPDIDAPKFTGIAASPITQTGATILWTTDEASDSLVEYGTTLAYGSSASNPGMVTSHAQLLGNLSANTLYHFRVKSLDAAGNLGVSPDYTFTTAAAPGEPPTITNILAAGVGPDRASISWTTNEPADSHVEYGTTNAYGSVTAIDTTAVTSHLVLLGGLEEKTTYHYRVKSRNSAGNLSISEDRTFTTESSTDTTPPEFFDVRSHVTATTASISWTTNEAATSQVEYGATTAYGSMTVKDTLYSTNHSQPLTGIRPGTLYHYRVHSEDAAGNSVPSRDYTFTTQSSFTMFYPRLLTTPGASADSLGQEYIGLGIANLDSQPATLIFTAYDASGAVINRPGITNPAILNLNPGQQKPVLDHLLFGASLSGPDAVGWVRIESDVTKIAGFFIMFNGGLSELDGADFISTPVTSFIFPEIRNQGFTKINIGNPNADPATLTFSLIGADGVAKATATRNVPGNGALVADLFTDIFTANASNSDSYVKVTSNQSVVPFELLGTPSRDFENLYGLDATLGAATLYCPQYVVGGAWSSALSIINLEPNAGYVTIRLFGDDAAQVGATRVQHIEPYGKILIDSPTFLDPFRPDENSVSQGYVKIQSNGLKLAGSVVFGDRNRSIFSSALPLSSGGDQSVVYAHIASDELYYTGVAIVNPDRNAAHISVDLYNEDGTLAMTAPLTIPAGARVSQLLTQLFPQLDSQHRLSGYFKVTSDVGVASFAVFGTRDLSVLSVIPPQIIR